MKLEIKPSWARPAHSYINGSTALGRRLGGALVVRPCWWWTVHLELAATLVRKRNNHLAIHSQSGGRRTNFGTGACCSLYNRISFVGRHSALHHLQNLSVNGFRKQK